MNSYDTYIQHIEEILGHQISGGIISLHIEWNNYEEARDLIQKIRSKQKELRALKRDVNQTCKELRSEFATRKTEVGKGIGSSLASAFVGRKAIGSLNALKRDDLRRSQADALKPYEHLKTVIDDIVHQLDQTKYGIETSEEYKVKPARKRRTKAKINTLRAKETRHYAFINDEVKGPFTVSELEGLIKASVVTSNTQLCVEGEQDWHPLSHFFNSK